MPYSDEVAAELGIQPPTDVLGRAGTQLVNAPSNIFNAFSRMWYNLGFKDEGSQPVELPTAPLAPARGFGEKAIDVAANLGEQIPLIMAGEGAVGALGKAAELPALLTRIAKPAAGFGVLGASESPTEGAVQGALGAGFGAAEVAPLPLKILLAGGIGAASAVENYQQTQDIKQAAAVGGAMSIVPFFMRNAKKANARVVGDLPTEDVQGEFPMTIGKTPPEGSLIQIPERPATIQTELPMTVGPTPPEGSLMRTMATREAQPPSMLTAEPIMTPTELRRGMGVTAPPGSLVRDATPSPLIPFPQIGEERPSIQSNGADAKVATIAQGGDAAMPVTVDGIKYNSQNEALDALNNILKPKANIAPIVESATAIPNTGRLTLKSILHTDDQATINKAASKLGVEFQGAWPGTNHLEFKIPNDLDHPAFGANFSVEQGATYKDLKNALQAKKDAFEVDRPQWEALKREKQGITPEPKPKIATLQLEERPVTQEEKSNEMYGESKWTHVVDVTDAQGASVGKIRGNVTDSGFQVKGANIEKGKRGQGTYQKVIQQLKEKYGSVQSDTDMQPAAEAAWKKVGATPQPDGSYKLGEVATLQPKAEPPPSPLEKAPTGDVRPPATGGQPIGQVVRVPHPLDNEMVTAKVVGPSPELPDHVRVKMSDGTDIDVKPNEIQGMPAPATDTNFKQQLQSEQDKVVSYGSAEDIAALQEQNARKGMKLGTRVGEHGKYDAEVALAMGKYFVAPVIGGTVAYAMSDPDHRIRNAIIAAVSIGLGAKFGTKIFAALAEAHPNVNSPGSFANAVKKDVENVVKAAVANPKMAETAVKSGQATGLEKIARWLEKNFVITPNRARIVQAATEQVRLVGEAMHSALAEVVAAKLPANNIQTIGDYFRGKITDADLHRLLNNPPMAQKVQLVATNRTALQNMILESLKPGKLRTAVKESIDKYVTTSYRLFTDAKYFPSDAQVETVAREMISKYRQGDPNLSIASMKEIIVGHLQELKSNKELFSSRGGFGASIGVILGRKHDLSDAFKNMLGHFDDPLHEMAATELKLVNGARNAQVIGMIADGARSDGIKLAMTGGERDVLKDQLRAMIQRATDPKQVATLQKQLADVQAYAPVALDDRFGRLAGLFLDRRMHDSLATWDGLSRWTTTPLAQVVGDVNNLVKYGHTVLSPLQFTRQVLSMPMLGIMAKTTPLDWAKAYKSLLHDPQELLRLRGLGVVGSSDFIGGVIREDLQSYLSGKITSKLQGTLLQRGLHQWNEIYRLPDLMSRVAAFQREEGRLLRMGMNKAEAAQRGIDYANRYAINYGAAPQGIQILRRLPFVNQYLTFAFEVARITKNLMQDVVQRRDPVAMGVLTTMATVPIIMQKVSESMLSPQDRNDWEKAKSLAPSYSRGNFKIVTGRLPNGNFHYIDFTPLIIHDKWMKMVRDVVNGDTGAFLADNPVLGWENTPLLNVATSQISGQDLHTKEKLGSISSRLDAIRRDLAPTLVGTDLDRFQEALTRNAEGGLGIMSPKTGREVSLGGMLSSYVTAVRGYTINPNYLVKQAVYDAKSTADSERMMMNRVLQTNAASDVKQAAISRYQAALKQIQMSLRDKLRISQVDFENAPSF